MTLLFNSTRGVLQIIDWNEDVVLRLDEGHCYPDKEPYLVYPFMAERTTCVGTIFSVPLILKAILTTSLVSVISIMVSWVFGRDLNGFEHLIL